MKKNRLFAFALGLGLSLAVSVTTFAQVSTDANADATTPSAVKNKIQTIKNTLRDENEKLRGATKEQNEKLRENIKANREKAKEQIKKIREDQKDAKRKNTEKKLEEHIGNASKRFNGAINNLTKVDARIDARIAILKQDGKDTTNAEKFSADAKTNIQLAKDAIAKLPAMETEGFQAEKLSQGLADLRTSLGEIQGFLKAAKEDLVKAIAEIKGLGPVVNKTTSENNQQQGTDKTQTSATQ